MRTSDGGDGGPGALARFLSLLIAGVALLAWGLVVAAVFRGDLSRWTGGGLFVAIAVGTWFLLGWSLQPAERGPDPLHRWREFPFVRRLELRADAATDCTLVVVLSRDDTGNAREVVLEFLGVRDLKLTQFGEYAMTFDAVCRDLGEGARDGCRYEVADRWNDTFRFRCRAFDESPRTAV